MKRKLIGVVGVDTGQLIIVDPSNIGDVWKNNSELFEVESLGEDQARQLNHRLGHEGLAVAFNSGLGDGKYKVYATYRDCGDWGERISKVEIELIDDEEVE